MDITSSLFIPLNLTSYWEAYIREDLRSLRSSFSGQVALNPVHRKVLGLHACRCIPSDGL